jgi:hypothetical protein
MPALTEDEFDLRFNYVPNPEDESFFWEQVPDDVAEERVWTAVDGDDDHSYLIPGFHIVNRFAYVVSQRPWTSEDVEVRLDCPDCPH